MLDLGCADGGWSARVGEKMSAGQIHGVEFEPEAAAQASKAGVQVKIVDLAGRFPFEDGQFDFVHANQVLEHVADVDHFASEIQRVLKPGRIAVVSTENASSWHNVAALSLGWQMFSLTNLSTRRLGLGNPLALHRNETGTSTGHIHRVIFSFLGLKEFFEAHDFEVLRIRGAGYYPLPAFFGVLDPRHAAFITATLRRKGS